LSTANPRQRASAARSEVPPEAGSCEGAPASALARHRREYREPFHAGGERWATWPGQGGWSGRTAAESARRHARGEGEWSGRIARRRERGGGDSRSRTRRGASGARRGCGGLRAERHTRERRERRHAPLVERPCGRTADVVLALARRAARRDARRGSCVRSGGGQGERSEGAGLRLRQRPAGRRPARYCGAEPHRRAETGKAGLATWTAAGKRRMSVVRHASRTAPNPPGHDARRRGLWRMVRVGIRDTARRDAGTLRGAGGGVQACGR